MKKYITCLFGFLPMFMSAQNITDLAVMNDRMADTFIGNSTQVSSIDDSVFVHPDRIRYDRQCIQIEGKDVFLFSAAFHYFRLWKAIATESK